MLESDGSMNPVSLARMMAGKMANQKLKDSATAGYWGQHSSMETEKH